MQHTLLLSQVIMVFFMAVVIVEGPGWLSVLFQEANGKTTPHLGPQTVALQNVPISYIYITHSGSPRVEHHIHF